MNKIYVDDWETLWIRRWVEDHFEYPKKYEWINRDYYAVIHVLKEHGYNAKIETNFASLSALGMKLVVEFTEQEFIFLRLKYG
jgi:hypothetical protein